MLCDDCHKNEANIHITQITPLGKTVKNLCEECAARYGDFITEAKKGHGFTVEDFLRGVFSPAKEEKRVFSPESVENKDNSLLDAASQGEKSPTPHEYACPNCGMTLRDFAATGKLGCCECYGVFRDCLAPILKRIHGTSAHSGKIPVRTGGTLAAKRQLAELKEQLKKAVAAEEYERAAVYRDEIRALENAAKPEDDATKDRDEEGAACR